MAGTRGVTDGNALLDLLVRDLLDIRVEAGLDLQAATLEEGQSFVGGVAEGLVIHDDVLNIVAEEFGLAPGCRTAVRGLVQVEVEVGLDRFVVFLLRDVVVFEHLPEHGVAAFEHLIGEPLRVERRRVLHDSGEHRRLLDVEILGVDAPVPVGGRFDAVDVRGARVVVDVHVAVENFLLVVLLLNRDSEFGLTQLTRIACGAFGFLRRFHTFGVILGMGVLCQHVLHVLLGQRRSALSRRGHHIVHRGTSDAFDVDAAVFEVPVVLDGDRRVLHILRDLVQRHLLAVLPVEFRKLRPVGGKHRRLLSQVLDLQGRGK